jgi:hypothetical protein
MKSPHTPSNHKIPPQPALTVNRSTSLEFYMKKFALLSLPFILLANSSSAFACKAPVAILAFLEFGSTVAHVCGKTSGSYPNGQATGPLFGVYYHENGRVAGPQNGLWFHANGQIAGPSNRLWYHSNGVVAGPVNGNMWFNANGSFAGNDLY